MAKAKRSGSRFRMWLLLGLGVVVIGAVVAVLLAARGLGNAEEHLAKGRSLMEAGAPEAPIEDPAKRVLHWAEVQRSASGT